MYSMALSAVLAAASTMLGADAMLSLRTGNTELFVTSDQGTLGAVKLEDTNSHYCWTSEKGAFPLVTTVSEGNTVFDVQWRSQIAGSDAATNTLSFVFTNDTPKMTLTSFWRARTINGPIEHWIEIKNESDQTIVLPQQDSLCLQLAWPAEATRACWVQRGGGNASTQGGFHEDPVTPGLALNLVSNCEDGASPVPWLALQTGDTRGLYVGWEFSGLGRISAKATADGKALEIRVGLPEDFKTDIAPGETFLVPPAFMGCYAGDLDAGAYTLHQWILEALRPSVPEGVADPTLAYNLYLDAGGYNATEADVLRCARYCHDLGFETFMPDAMWFPSTGDWRWDPKRFPNGVTPIEEYVHESGMKLALWCAWTNGGISEDPGALSVRGAVGHPDWFTGDFSKHWKPAAFSGGQVCLGCDAARDWEIAKTQWLVGNHKLDYLKHDCGPIANSCNKTDHRHHFGVDASYWATMGYYRVQEELRKAFPNLLLENCSGGGHIKDFGVIQRTHYTVTTDTLSNLPDRRSIWDSTFAFPPVVLQAYTYEWEYHVPGDEPEPFLWRSAMMSAWQIDPTRTEKWTPEQKDLAKRHADIYKEWVRPMLRDAKVHHILPRPDGEHWDGMFYWSPSLGRGTLYIFRPDASEEAQTIRLKGLDANASYWLWTEDGSAEAKQWSGAALMDSGIPIVLPQRYSSDLVYLRDAAQGAPEGLDAPAPFTLGGVTLTPSYFTSSADLAWAETADARSYEVVVASDPEFKTILTHRRAIRPAMHLDNLVNDQTCYWKVQATTYGGTRWNDGGPASFDIPKQKELQGISFISDLHWVNATAGADNKVHRDTNYTNTPIQIAGKTYPKGVWTHAFNDATPAEVTVDLTKGQYRYFAATAGVESAANGGSVQFQVLCDGMLSEESPVLHCGESHAFHVDLNGAKTLTLRVLNGGDGYACDHAAWGFARLVAEGAEDPFL